MLAAATVVWNADRNTQASLAFIFACIAASFEFLVSFFSYLWLFVIIVLDITALPAVGAPSYIDPQLLGAASISRPWTWARP